MLAEPINSPAATIGITVVGLADERRGAVDGGPVVLQPDLGHGGGAEADKEGGGLWHAREADGQSVLPELPPAER